MTSFLSLSEAHKKFHAVLSTMHAYQCAYSILLYCIFTIDAHFTKTDSLVELLILLVDLIIYHGLIAIVHVTGQSIGHYGKGNQSPEKGSWFCVSLSHTSS